MDKDLKRIDLHMHSFFSDGELLPSEIVRQCDVLNHEAIAITDHADASNIDELLKRMKTFLALQGKSLPIRVIPGVEISYVHPDDIDKIAQYAKKRGAKIVVVHGETTGLHEPVYPGTNMAAVSSKYVDLLAHPGNITEEQVKTAVKNNVMLEITCRRTHQGGNKTVADLGQKNGAKIVVNTDAHSHHDFVTTEKAIEVARTAGVKEENLYAAVYGNAAQFIGAIK
jgi:putative hydrolase